MTTVTALVNREDFDNALLAGRTAGDGGELPGLAAPLAGALAGRVQQAWAAVESVLREGWEHGRELASAKLDAAVARIEQLATEAGIHARDLRAAVLAKLQSFLEQFVDAALAKVRGEVLAGGRTLPLTGIQVAHRISLSGSVKASIQEILALTSAGELEVSAQYGEPH